MRHVAIEIRERTFESRSSTFLARKRCQALTPLLIFQLVANIQKTPEVRKVCMDRGLILKVDVVLSP
jgi:hypothetical protein